MPSRGQNWLGPPQRRVVGTRGANSTPRANHTTDFLHIILLCRQENCFDSALTTSNRKRILLSLAHPELAVAGRPRRCHTKASKGSRMARALRAVVRHERCCAGGAEATCGPWASNALALGFHVASHVAADPLLSSSGIEIAPALSTRTRAMTTKTRFEQTQLRRKLLTITRWT